MSVSVEQLLWAGKDFCDLLYGIACRASLPNYNPYIERWRMGVL